MNEIATYIGLGLCIIGGIGLLIAAFRTGILWGLAVLFIAPVVIFYLIVHWEDAKGPFKIQIVGILIILVFSWTNGEIELFSPVVSNVADIRLSAPAISSFSSSIAPSQRFECDGRQYCSQMHSRAEAEFFLRNCPSTKMDGDHDGIPCENDSRF